MLPAGVVQSNVLQVTCDIRGRRQKPSRDQRQYKQEPLGVKLHGSAILTNCRLVSCCLDVHLQPILVLGQKVGDSGLQISRITLQISFFKNLKHP
jgi:hypothetical protein